MPRPCKVRRICMIPRVTGFIPRGSDELRSWEKIVMSLDEYETIRLIDFEELTQEECASIMGVARTTVQAIYNSARHKIAQCMVFGKELSISGGDYEICKGHDMECGHSRCRKAKYKNIMGKGEFDMKIAATYENGKIFQHFGHTEQFMLYNVEDNKVVSKTLVSTNGSGHGALAGLLKELGADALICGGIGGGARVALTEAGIKLYGGVVGEADKAVEALLSGNLDFNPDVECNHHGHDHDHGHDCSSHHHGEGHSCGHHCHE